MESYSFMKEIIIFYMSLEPVVALAFEKSCHDKGVVPIAMQQVSQIKNMEILKEAGMYKLLIVEDDKVLKFGLKKCLEEEGYSVAVSENYTEVSGVLKSETVDLVILDVNLPGKDGFEIYRQMVSVRKIPAIFLTARDEEDDIVKGFDLGAEDYITKPFSINVFLKKIAAIMRRCYGKEGSVIVQGDLTVYPDERKVLKKNAQVNLSPTEYKILEVFLRNINRVLTKDALIESIWDKSVNWSDESALAVNINRLRNKIGHQYIQTVFGVGYMWGVKDETDEC